MAAPVRYLSLFSGIEAASVAFRPLGWEAAAFSEIDPFCCEVLAHHYPKTASPGNASRSAISGATSPSNSSGCQGGGFGPGG